MFYDQIEEATLNAALATIDFMQPRSELCESRSTDSILVPPWADRQRRLNSDHRPLGSHPWVLWPSHCETSRSTLNCNSSSC